MQTAQALRTLIQCAPAVKTAFTLFDRDWIKDIYGQDVSFRHYLFDRSLYDLQPTMLFDGHWYRLQNEDVRRSDTNPFVHYLRYGWKEGRNPHRLFSSDWVIRTQLNVDDDLSPLESFYGTARSYQLTPHPLLDLTRLSRDRGEASGSLEELYVTLRALMRQEYIRPPHALLLEACPDREELDALPCLQSFGDRFSRHPYFDHRWYIMRYDDVRRSGADPLVHYLEHGDREGRDPNEMFDTDWYKRRYTEMAGFTGTALEHYVVHGARAMLRPSPVFDPQRYVSEHGLSIEPRRALEHYLASRRDRAADLGPSEKGPVPDIRSNSARVPLIVELAYDQVVSPADLGESDDTRSLALALRSIQICVRDSGALVADVRFGPGGNARDFVLYGVSHTEGWGSWTLGSKTAFLFWFSALPEGCLELVLDADRHHAIAHLRITVSVSNGLWAQSTFSRGDRILLAPLLFLDDRFSHFVSLLSPKAAAKTRSRTLRDTPVVSVIILNYNRSQLSIMAATSVLNHRGRVPLEVVIVDNGSSAEELRILQNSDVAFRLVRIATNRFFGEGNNIGFEATDSEYVLFLNNDAFATEGLTDGLVDVLASRKDIGAVGPVFFYPDGRLQEAGGFVDEKGDATQRGKGDKGFRLHSLSPVDDCDYVSAACIMIRSHDFRRVGGFNYRYDPAYYEDTDLCFRMLLLGKTVAVIASARCFHIENATTADPTKANISTSVVARNKAAFLSLWGSYLQSRSPDDLPSFSLFRSKSCTSSVSPKSGVYSPYPLTVGGGERYILATAAAMEKPAAFFSPDAYSNLRLKNVLTDLAVVAPDVMSMRAEAARNLTLQCAVVMGNELRPSYSFRADRQYFHCQFPFPDHWSKEEKEAGDTRLSAMDGVIVNSQFTKDAYARRLRSTGLQLPIIVCHPPVATRTLLGLQEVRRKRILSIGRFTDAGHGKRQDVIIEAFSQTSETFRAKWELVLCGGVAADATGRQHIERLETMAQGLPVTFVLGPSREELVRQLSLSSLYVQATGYGVTRDEDYHLCEHFGIAVVEAIAAGCKCAAYEVGGPAEILRSLKGAGETFREIDDLVSTMQGSDDNALSTDIRLLADEMFGEDAFTRRMQETLYGKKI